MGTAARRIAVLRPDGARPLLAADVTVSGAATVDLRTPSGAVLQTSTTAGAGGAAFHLEGAALPEYHLWVSGAAPGVSVAVEWAVSA